MGIPDGITRQDVLEAIEEIGRTGASEFGDSTKYDLVFEGRHFPPKAVVGYAARRVRAGEILPSTEFSGGGGHGQANHLLRELGFEIEPKSGDSPESEGELDDSRHTGVTLGSLVDEWEHRDTPDPVARSESWLQNREAVLDALERLRASRDLVSFAASLGALPQAPAFFKRGAHRTFLGALADRASDPRAAEIIAAAFDEPTDESDAETKISALFELADNTESIYPGPGFAPLAASAMWCFQNPIEWPWLSSEAETSLWTLRILAKNLSTTDRYLHYRRVVLTSDRPPTEVIATLVHANKHGFRSLSQAVFDRLQENADVLKPWYVNRQYDRPEDEARSERNIHAALGEFDMLAKGMNEDIAEQLVRTLVTSKTGPRVGFANNLPFRADAYAIHTVEKNMAMPAIRIWATPSGLAIGAHYGSQETNADYTVMAAELLEEGLPNEIQFFDVRPHKAGDRLTPVGEDVPKGEFFVGKWFKGGLTGAAVGDAVLATVAQLQPAFDSMVVAAGKGPAVSDTAADPLAEVVAEFFQVEKYPTEADQTDKAERDAMAAVISEDGLLGFDVAEFRRIYNTSRYGSPGPQSILNSTLGHLTAEELDVFATNIEYLLRGHDPLEERIDRLMDQADRGIRGLGEAVIMKLLAIEYPREILPTFVFRGKSGKGRMLAALDIKEDGLNGLETGRRAVRSNELLFERLAPFFGDDTFGMKRFLYWYLERHEIADEPPDETDHIGNLADDVHIDRGAIDEIVEMLEDKGQIVFYGPPGTGKTYLARLLARALAPDPAQRILVQFHPSTSYEDFFEGFRPDTGPDGQLSYRLVKGPLALIAERARDNPSKPYVLVIDEINRANLPKVFGELLFLLEYRDETVRSLYRPDEPFDLPKNLRIIGTMNTADRSIALVDAAMRRRFHFFRFFPNEGLIANVLRDWLGANGQSGEVADLLDMVNAELRERLGGPHLQIGPSHFMRDDLSDKRLEQIWSFSVFPFIEEQLYGDPAGIREYEFAKVMKRLQAKVAPVDELEGDGADDSPAPGMG